MNQSDLTFEVILQGPDGTHRLATPEEHEWWCPFGIQIELIRLDTQSRKSSAASSSRKSCKMLHEFEFAYLELLLTLVSLV